VGPLSRAELGGFLVDDGGAEEVLSTHRCHELVAATGMRNNADHPVAREK
jgi:hypothetical protein